jgi:DNA adenine methylase
MSAAPDLHADHAPAPFLKWAGGKGKLLAEILPRLPSKIRTYHEPFIGGGAVFFALAAEGRFTDALIGDRNPALVEAYRVVKSDVAALIDALEEHADRSRSGGGEDYFYAVRDAEPTTPIARVARLIYLNKTCFNGLYRVNRSGKFNVPFGRYKNPRICNAERLRAASKALRDTTILHADFERVAIQAGPKDAVYFDPPYVPISASSSFTAYDANPFGMEEHRRLAALYVKLVRSGVAAVLSNSDCEETRALYRGLDVRTVGATRAINSVAAKRGTITELLVIGASSREPAKAVSRRG